MAAQSKTDLVIASVRRLLRVGASANLLNLLQKRHPVDIAEILRALNDHERRAAVDAMAAADPRLAMQVVAELGVDMGAGLLASRPAREVVRLLQELAPDDAAALIDRFPEPLADEVREQMRGQHPTAEIAEVLEQREGTAGRIMNPRVFALREDATAGEAVNAIQQLGGNEMSFYLYVIDERRHLVGVVSLRRLLLVPPQARLKDIMTTDVISVTVDTPEEEVARKVSSYHLLAVPVVDHENKLVGTVTVDDVIEVIRDTTTEEFQKLGGLEALDEPYVRTPLLTLVKKRARWLVVLFLGEMLTATAMGYYEREIAKAVVLALFVPLVISSGGNSGSQAASLIIRALAVGEVTLRDWWRIMRREVLSGLALGAILGSVGFVRVSLWQQLFGTYGAHWFLIALTVLFALVGVVMWGTLAGSMLPFVMKRLGADPATSSAPFVATLVDVTGLVIYFSVAATILRGTLL
ncbi:MAG TPA: magnesium transporter [Vicinamibacterales bacterium]|nr:magnesium transporter [Vicinamibacterales bacterium]